MNRTRFNRSFETLETRTMLAGDVMGEVVDGVLTLQGDGRENWIEIQQVAPNSFLVIGLDSPVPGDGEELAPTKINGSESEVFSGVRDFSVKMAGEDDLVFFNGDTAQGASQAMVIPGSVTVFGNHGGDNILFEDTTIRKAVNIRGNTGEIPFNSLTVHSMRWQTFEECSKAIPLVFSECCFGTMHGS